MDEQAAVCEVCGKGPVYHCVECGNCKPSGMPGRCRSCHSRYARSLQTHSVYSDETCKACGGKLTVHGRCKGCEQTGISVPSRGWKWDEDHRNAQAERMKGNTLRRGTVLGVETCLAIGNAIRGIKRSPETCLRLKKAMERRKERLGYYFSPEVRKRLRSLWGKETSIERKTKGLLLSWQIQFEQEKFIPGIGLVDFLVPGYRVIIECDGGYWYSLPKQIEEDARRDKEASVQGYKVLRLPENQIKYEWEICMQRVFSLLTGEQNGT